MMKSLLLVLLTSLSLSAFSQVDLSDYLDDAEKSVEKAMKEYQDAEKELEKIRKDRMNAENDLEKARVNLRKAKLAQAELVKKANPIEVKRYEVMANPVYEEMSQGVQYGYSVFLPNTETSGLTNFLSKNVDNHFKDYMKNYKSDKVRKKRGELFFDNIIIPEISSTSIDLYADFDEQKNGVTIYTYFNMGNEFLNFSESSSAVRNAENIMDHFARYIRKDNLETRLKEQEKQLKDLQKDLEDSKGEISKAKEDINGLEADIIDYRNSINALETEIDQTNDSLERTRLHLSNVE